MTVFASAVMESFGVASWLCKEALCIGEKSQGTATSRTLPV